MDVGVFDAPTPAPPASGWTGARIAAGLLGLTAILVFSACGLLPGGDSEEEPGAVDELAALKKDVQTADSLASAERVKSANLQAEVDALKKQIAEGDQVKAGGLISLERARLEVVRHAQQNVDVYGAPYADVLLVWEVFSAEEQEEFYYIKLTYRPFGTFAGRAGLEEYIVDKDWEIEFRQVLEAPDPEGDSRQNPPEKKAEGG